MEGHTHAYDAKYKVLLVGDSGVGKTALIRALQGHKFRPNMRATVGIDFVEEMFQVDGSRIQLQIWDTAGQERFRTITRFQYRGTKGLLLVYDVTCKSSFAMINYWLDSIDKEIDHTNKEPIPVYIIANKCDLEEQRVVSTAQGKKLADSTYVHGFLEVSAKDGINVQQAFQKLATAVVEINHPKTLNSFLTQDEREERVRRRMGELFYANNHHHHGHHHHHHTPQRKNSIVVTIKLNSLQHAIKDQASKCPCG